MATDCSVDLDDFEDDDFDEEDLAKLKDQTRRIAAIENDLNELEKDGVVEFTEEG